MHQNHQICRTCLCVGDATFLSLDAVVPNSDLIPIKEKISVCVPELGLDVVPDAVICLACLSALHTAFSFKRKCRKTEERIQDYIHSRKRNLSKVDLRKIIDPMDANSDIDFSDDEPSDLRLNLKKNNSRQHLQTLTEKAVVVKSEVVEGFHADVSLIKVEPIDCTYRSIQQQNQESAANTNVVFNSLESSNKPHKCRLCAKAYKREIGLFAHMRMHEENQMNNLPKQTSVPKRLQTEIKHFLPKQFDNIDAICEICQKTFYSKSNLTVHMRIHTGEKPYQCNICAKAFTQKVYLTAHERTHTGEKPFKCSLCDKSFAQKSYLRTHMIVHTGVRHHICKVCGKGCAHTGDLNNHMRIHTGEKPYKCKACGKCFTQSVHLKSHVKIHSGEKPFECQLCHAQYTESRYLKKHMRIHTGERPYTCEICSKAFRERYILTEHLKSHTGKKLCVCTICSKTYTKSSHLTEHMRTHTGEKQNLNVHMKCDTKSSVATIKSEPFELQGNGSEPSMSSTGQRHQNDFRANQCRFLSKENTDMELQDETFEAQEKELESCITKYFIRKDLQQNTVVNDFIKTEPCIPESGDAN